MGGNSGRVVGGARLVVVGARVVVGTMLVIVVGASVVDGAGWVVVVVCTVVVVVDGGFAVDVVASVPAEPQEARRRAEQARIVDSRIVFGMRRPVLSRRMHAERRLIGAGSSDSNTRGRFDLDYTPRM